MDHNKLLRRHLIKVLEGSEAHAEFEAAVADMPFALQGKLPKGAEHSPWQELEHLRIAQWDIFEFAVDPKHKSPKFPDGYWPSKPAPPDEKAWVVSAQTFVSDRKRFAKVLENESTDVCENSAWRRADNLATGFNRSRSQRLPPGTACPSPAFIGRVEVTARAWCALFQEFLQNRFLFGRSNHGAGVTLERSVHRSAVQRFRGRPTATGRRTVAAAPAG